MRARMPRRRSKRWRIAKRSSARREFSCAARDRRSRKPIAFCSAPVRTARCRWSRSRRPYWQASQDCTTPRRDERWDWGATYKVKRRAPRMKFAGSVVTSRSLLECSLLLESHGRLRRPFHRAHLVRSNREAHICGAAAIESDGERRRVTDGHCRKRILLDARNEIEYRTEIPARMLPLARRCAGYVIGDIGNRPI